MTLSCRGIGQLSANALNTCLMPVKRLVHGLCRQDGAKNLLFEVKCEEERLFLFTTHHTTIIRYGLRTYPRRAV